MKQGAMHTPTRPFEFIPCTVINNSNLTQEFKRYAYYDINTDVYYTNLRNIYKNYKKQWVKYEKSNGFVVYKIKVPMFIRDQIMTHTQLSKINTSNRVRKQNENQYYCPYDFLQRIKKHKGNIYAYFIGKKYKTQTNFINYICQN